MEQSPSWEAKWFSATQKLPAHYGTQRFINTFTSACHLSLSSASICASNCITQDSTTEYIPEWKATCSNGVIWCVTLIIYKILAVVTVTQNVDSFKFSGLCYIVKENYWLAANQTMSSVLQKIYIHVATLMSMQKSVTHYYFPCRITAFIVNIYPQVE